MAAGGWVVSGSLQVLFITTLLYKQIITTPTTEGTGTYQDYYGTTESTQLYSYRKLQTVLPFWRILRQI